MRFLKEPLLHFCLLGAVLFAVHGWRNRGAVEPDRILISRGQVDAMIEGFTRTWQRAPDAGELEDLIRDRLREEALYREALTLGLDRDDTVIRRRLRQKMEFITDGVSILAEPTEADLQAHLLARADRFATPSAFSFRHVFFRDQSQPSRPAEEALERLRRGGRAEEEGNPFLLGLEFKGISPAEISGLLGPEFASGLGEAKVGEWIGPLSSSYGSHLVLVTEKTPGRPPSLDQVRETVADDWREAQREKARELLANELLARYQVVVEPPSGAPSSTTAVGEGR